MLAIRPIAATANVLGEAPLWCDREQALWWVDVQQASLWKWQASAGAVRSWRLPKSPGSIALLEDGGLLIAFSSGFAVWHDADLRWLDVPGMSLGDERFNDGKVDRRGRFWVGSLDRALHRPIGRLYCLAGLGNLRAVDAGFALSNGIGWSPDDRTMYFAETQARRIYRYNFDLETGEASNRRLFVQFPAGKGGPDGLTVDAAGGIWCALFDRGCVERYLPDGSLDRRIDLPVGRPTSCAFGGPDMRTLFITTARLGLSDDEVAAEPLAGAVLAVDVAETGIPESRCSLTRRSIDACHP